MSQLRAFVERIERLQEEKRSIESDIKDIYAEIAASGYDKKIVREVVKRRGKGYSEISEFEELLAIYEAEIKSGLSRAPHARDAREGTKQEAPSRDRLTKADYQPPRYPHPTITELRQAKRDGTPISQDFRHWEGKVYFAERASDGALKVGISNNIAQRLRALKNEFAADMQLIGWFDGCTQDERFCHDKLKAWSIGGEWFSADAVSSAQSLIKQFSERAPDTPTPVPVAPLPEIDITIPAFLDRRPLHLREGAGS